MPLWNFPQAWLYDERYSPDFQFWSEFPYIFTKSIAKKLNSNEMSSLRASLALRNVHWKDALRGIQTSFHLWVLSNEHTDPFGTSCIPAFPRGSGRAPGLHLGSASAYGSEHQEGIVEDTGLGKQSCRRNLEDKEGTCAFTVLVYRVTWEARSEAGKSQMFSSGSQLLVLRDSMQPETPETERDHQRKQGKNMRICVHVT